MFVPQAALWRSCFLTTPPKTSLHILRVNKGPVDLSFALEIHYESVEVLNEDMRAAPKLRRTAYSLPYTAEE